jgi:hypothetical protein
MSPRHTEHARRIDGFIWQTMCDRGLRCERNDLATALQELTPKQLQVVESAANALHRGNDAEDLFKILSTFRLVSARRTRHALQQAHLMYRADVLLAAERSHGPSFEQHLRMVVEPMSVNGPQRDEALAKLRGWLGVLQEAAPVPETGTGRGDRSDSGAAPAHEAAWDADPAGSGDVNAELAMGAGRPAEVDFGPSDPAEHGGRRAPPRRKAVVYGAKGALQMEIAPLRQGPDQTGAVLASVMIEGALANGHTGDGYAWHDKIQFACTLRELHQVLAVLMGWTDQLELKFHGHDRKKSLLMEHQSSGLFVSLRHDRKKVAVPVLDCDRYALAMLVLAAMQFNEPHLDGASVLAVVRAMATVPEVLTR